MAEATDTTRADGDEMTRLAAAVEQAERWASVAAAARLRLEAFDAATVAISQELSLERVLALIVDSVRPLASARYAALGIFDDQARIERFITSGISDDARRAIGHLPTGRGLLGAVVRLGHPLRVPVLADDPRSVGFPARHPPMASFLGVPIRVEGRSIGNLYLTDKQDAAEFSEDDERLVVSFARHAGLAIHNARLHEELRHLAVLQERERIAQDLHDGSIQSLYAVSLSLEECVELLDSEPGAVPERIDRAIEAIHGTIREIREFITALDGRASPAAELTTGLARLAEDFERSTDATVVLTVDPSVVVPGEMAVQLLQLTREALSNVVRHAGATRVTIDVTREAEGLTLAISDDGRGFDPREPQRPGHHGLTNMQARAESLGGSLTISSDMTGSRLLLRLQDPDQLPYEDPSP